MVNNLKKFRTERGMTLSDLSLEVGLAVATLSKLENGLMPVSDRTRDIFGVAYPHYDFAFGIKNNPRYLADKYKERIVELEGDITYLKKDKEALQLELNRLYHKLDNIQKVLFADKVSVRVFEEGE